MPKSVGRSWEYPTCTMAPLRDCRNPPHGFAHRGWQPCPCHRHHGHHERLGSPLGLHICVIEYFKSSQVYVDIQALHGESYANVVPLSLPAKQLLPNNHSEAFNNYECLPDGSGKLVTSC